MDEINEFVSNFWSVNTTVVKIFQKYAPAGLRDLQPNTAEPSTLSLTEISPWTNRVPMHEPWPRVLKIDEGDKDDGKQNEENDGYKNNVDWLDQYTNEGDQKSTKPIGVVEGDETNDRGPFWRR